MKRTMHTFMGGALLTLPCLAASAQSPAAAPAFELADVHVSPHSANPFMRGGALRGDRFLVRSGTMVELIANAYNVDPLNVLGGPAWLDLDHFDISAKAAKTTSPEDVRLMLRTLLAERFKLDVQTDIKSQPAYVLSAGKTPKLKQADGTGGGCVYQPPPKDTPQTATMANITFACHDTTMTAFGEFLHQVGQPYMSRPLVDATGLKGGWDFEIHWSYQPPKGGADGIPLFEAVDKQLGLKLEAKSAPLPVVLVKSVNERPTANAAELTKMLPPPAPAEFEVAVIKPHAPKEKHFGIQINGGNINILFGSLETLISFGWDIDKAMIVRGNNVLDADEDFFDIVGKASSEAPPGPGGGPGIDIDDLREMVRSLMKDRFKLQEHMEDRPYDAYTLTAAGPKMKKAEPGNRASCKEGPGPDGKDPRIANPVLSRLLYCQSMSMAEFADQLQGLASGYIKTPVLDATGLDGAYDFTLSFSSAGAMTGGAAPSASSDASTPSDPSGGVSLFTALSKQLGLKLEKQKRPVAMLVIDHIEQKPTEN